MEKKIVALEAKLAHDLHEGFAQPAGQLGQFQGRMAEAHRAIDQRATAEVARIRQEALQQDQNTKDLIKK